MGACRPMAGSALYSAALSPAHRPCPCAGSATGVTESLLGLGPFGLRSLARWAALCAVRAAAKRAALSGSLGRRIALGIAFTPGGARAGAVEGAQSLRPLCPGHAYTLQ